MGARQAFALDAADPRRQDPILWDFGSAAVHHKLYSPWLPPENCKAGLVGLRGTVDPAFGLMKHHAEEMASILKAAGVAKMPIGVDIIEPPMMFELQKAGLTIKDAQQVMLSAREVKSSDEIALLNRAAAMVDGAYHMINDTLRPGVRENDIVAEVNKFLYTHGSDDVEAVNAISGERCSPHPHNFTDRMIRPGDQAFFDILQSFMGYRTCYYRTFNVGRATPAQHDAYKMARDWLDNAMARIKPGASTAHICEVFPKAEEFGFPDEMTAFGLQFAHGLGLNLHERPIISRVVSMDHPTEIKEGMVFAIETYCPATDGYLRRAHRGRGRGHRQGLHADLAVPGRGAADRGEILNKRTRAALRNIESRGMLTMRQKPIGQGTSVKKFSNIQSRSLLCAMAGVLTVLMVAGGNKARRGPGLRRGGPLHPGRDAAVQRVHPGRRPHRGLPQGQAEAVDPVMPERADIRGPSGGKSKKRRARRQGCDPPAADRRSSDCRCMTGAAPRNGPRYWHIARLMKVTVVHSCVWPSRVLTGHSSAEVKSMLLPEVKPCLRQSASAAATQSGAPFGALAQRSRPLIMRAVGSLATASIAFLVASAAPLPTSAAPWPTLAAFSEKPLLLAAASSLRSSIFRLAPRRWSRKLLAP